MTYLGSAVAIPAELFEDRNVKPRLAICQRHHESGAVLSVWKLTEQIAFAWHVLDETRAITRDIRQDVVGRFPEFEVGSSDFFREGSIGADLLKKGPPPSIVAVLRSLQQEIATLGPFKGRYHPSRNIFDAEGSRLQSPDEAIAAFPCKGSYSLGTETREYIAVRSTLDGKAMQLVRVNQFGDVLEEYPQRYSRSYEACLIAMNRALNWDRYKARDSYAALSDEHDITKALKANPWADVVWEREHPKGPVCTVWHLAPLPLFVAGWVPIAGSKTIPSLVDWGTETDPALVRAAVADMGARCFAAGPSDKMVKRSQSAASKYQSMLAKTASKRSAKGSPAGKASDARH